MKQSTIERYSRPPLPLGYEIVDDWRPKTEDAARTLKVMDGIFWSGESQASRGSARLDVVCVDSSYLETLFDALATQWEQETALLSSAKDITDHRSYRAIIALGPTVVPFIIDKLKDEPQHWFVALEVLTGESLACDEPTMDSMASAWIEWARTRELI